MLSISSAGSPISLISFLLVEKLDISADRRPARPPHQKAQTCTHPSTSSAESPVLLIKSPCSHLCSLSLRLSLPPNRAIKMRKRICIESISSLRASFAQSLALRGLYERSLRLQTQRLWLTIWVGRGGCVESSLCRFVGRGGGGK